MHRIYFSLFRSTMGIPSPRRVHGRRLGLGILRSKLFPPPRPNSSSSSASCRRCKAGRWPLRRPALSQRFVNEIWERKSGKEKKLSQKVLRRSLTNGAPNVWLYIQNHKVASPSRWGNGRNKRKQRVRWRKCRQNDASVKNWCSETSSLLSPPSNLCYPLTAHFLCEFFFSSF